MTTLTGGLVAKSLMQKQIDREKASLSSPSEIIEYLSREIAKTRKVIQFMHDDIELLGKEFVERNTREFAEQISMYQDSIQKELNEVTE